MKFYDCSTAPSPRRVRMFIAEKGIEMPTVQVDLRGGEQFSDWFRAKNPRCTVPVLELDDGTCISESIAIASYLERIFPEPPLLGRDAREHALVLMWTQRVDVEGVSAIAEVLRNSAKGFQRRALTGPAEYDQIPELVSRGRARAEAFLRDLDGRLVVSSFVASDQFSMADINAFVAVEFAAWIKLGIPDACQALKGWHARIAARPSARV